MANITETTNTVGGSLYDPCLCGCKMPVRSSSATYLPGHDARHAGRIAEIMHTEPREMWAGFAAAARLSDRLTLKAYARAERLATKNAKALHREQVREQARQERLERKR